MITIRGQILVSRTNDDLLPSVCMYKTPSVCRFKTSLCVPAPRAHVSTHVRVVLVHTGRFEHTHGDVWSGHTGFSACHHTPHTTTTNNTTTTTTHTQHNTQHHTETERDRERRQRKRDKERETREDETR